jgi:hypothetical protein
MALEKVLEQQCKLFFFPFPKWLVDVKGATMLPSSEPCGLSYHKWQFVVPSWELLVLYAFSHEPRLQSHSIYYCIASRKQNKRYCTKSFIHVLYVHKTCLSHWGRNVHRRWRSTGCWRSCLELRKTHTAEGAFALQGCYTPYVGSTLSMFRETYKFYFHGWRN